MNPSCTNTVTHCHQKLANKVRKGGSDSSMRGRALQPNLVNLQSRVVVAVVVATKAIGLQTTPNHPIIADMADSEKEQSDESIEKKEESKPEVVVPPPPEKPLPGDCCGSGCVRCVWDVYYEELEEYNNRLKNGSNNEAQSKS